MSIRVLGAGSGRSVCPAIVTFWNSEPLASGAAVQLLLACARMTSAVIVGAPALISAFRPAVWAEATALGPAQLAPAMVDTTSAVAAGAAGTLSSSWLAGAVAEDGQDWLAVENVL